MSAVEETQLIFTTNPGLEDIVGIEWQTRLRRHELPAATVTFQPHGLNGYIQVRSAIPLARLWSLAQRMRSIHHVHRPVCYFALDGAAEAAATTASQTDPMLAAIARTVRCLSIPELDTARSFRVTSKRRGRHNFTSIDVQRAAGAALVDTYQCRVDLTGYDVDVRVDVLDRHCYVAVQMTHRPLDFRFHYAYRPRVALKTNVAFALLYLAGLQPDGVRLAYNFGDDDGTSVTESSVIESAPHPPASGVLLDPFCGSGTILLEAASCLPHMTICGSDRYERPVAWTRDNVAANGLAERIAVQQLDAQDLAQIHPRNDVRAIITNPPFGSFLGANANFHQLYHHFLRAAWSVLMPGGVLALTVWKRSIFNRVVADFGYDLRHVRIVDLGGLFPGIFVLGKPE